MTRVSIKTSRLSISDLSPDEAREVFAYRAAPEVARYQAFRPASVSEVAAFIRDATRSFDVPGAWFQLGIRDGEGLLVGDIGLHFLAPDGASCEIGYTIRPERQRRGYGREAALGVLGFLFGELGKEEVVASVIAGNEASRGLLVSLGFEESGAGQGPEGEGSEVAYSLSREAWSARDSRS